MNKAAKYLYTRAAGISLVVHLVLVGIILTAGHLLTKPITAAAPIEVEMSAAGAAEPQNSHTELSAADYSQTEGLHQDIAAGAELQAAQQSCPMATDGLNKAAFTPGAAQTVSASKAASTGQTVNIGHNAQQAGTEKKSVTRTQACCVASSRPPYPREALSAGWEGSVVVRVLIATDGTASQAAVQSSSGHSVLDEAAKQAVRKWRFSPARQNNSPIESYYDVRVKFILAEAEDE
ncbi:MAG: energy transducer TonB [Pelosinus sp.]|nr:energy transducer TonB [Pelosinus sp.]